MDWICFINGNQALCFSSVAGAETLPLMGIIREARVFRGQILMVSPSCLALQMKGLPGSFNKVCRGRILPGRFKVAVVKASAFR